MKLTVFSIAFSVLGSFPVVLGHPNAPRNRGPGKCVTKEFHKFHLLAEGETTDEPYLGDKHGSEYFDPIVKSVFIFSVRYYHQSMEFMKHVYLYCLLLGHEWSR